MAEGEATRRGREAGGERARVLWRRVRELVVNSKGEPRGSANPGARHPAKEARALLATKCPHRVVTQLIFCAR